MPRPSASPSRSPSTSRRSPVLTTNREDVIELDDPTVPSAHRLSISFSQHPVIHDLVAPADALLLGTRSSRFELPADQKSMEADQETLEEEMISRKERAFALLVACMLSIGSHYGSYLLGPLKSRLSREMGTSNTQFSLLLAALSFNNTWTPLVGGILTTRFGTPLASIIATSIVFLGQFIVMLSTGSGGSGSIKGMACGLFIFGMGVSPLAVVQETIIVRYFSNHGLGVSLALGLVAGKGASFLSSITSYPLSDYFGMRGPFVVSTLFAGVSFAVNIVYLIFHARVHPASSSKSQEEAARKVVQKRSVKLLNLARLGDPFWIYLLLNVFCGAIWSPFLHLSSNLIQRRYQMADARSASYASLLLMGSIFLYPLAGYIHDLSHRMHHNKFKAARSPSSSSSSSERPGSSSHVVYKLLTAASVLTLTCFIWLVLPPTWTRTPIPAMLSFGLGHGFATLLLVLVVPGLVGPEWVSTALGAHKSMEAAATTFSQTLSGLLLDTKIRKPSSLPPVSSNITDTPSSLFHSVVRRAPSNDELPKVIPPNTPAVTVLLFTFLMINICQLFTVIALWRSVRRIRRMSSEMYRPVMDHFEREDHLEEEFSEDVPGEDGDDDDDDDHHNNINKKLLSPSAQPSPSKYTQRSRHSRSFSSSSKRPLLWSDPIGSSNTIHSHSSDSDDEAEEGADSIRQENGSRSRAGSSRMYHQRDEEEEEERDRELKRGKIFFALSFGFLIIVWATFGTVILVRLGKTRG